LQNNRHQRPFCLKIAIFAAAGIILIQERKYFMPSYRYFFLAALFVLLAAMTADAADVWVFVTTQRDVNEDVGRAGIGTEVGFKPIPQANLLLQAKGELGGAVVDHPSLDYRLEGGIGYELQIRHKVSLTPILHGGYRQWYQDVWHADRSHTSYVLAGIIGNVRLAPKCSAFAEAAGDYQFTGEKVTPYVETGIQAAILKTSLFFEKLILNNGHAADIFGLKLGLAF
jgi:hypothetical protein